MALMRSWIPRLRRSRVAEAFLRGVNAGVVALILAMSLTLFRAAVVGVWTALILLAGLLALLRLGADTLWLVLGGAAIGPIRYLLISS